MPGPAEEDYSYYSSESDDESAKPPGATERGGSAKSPELSKRDVEAKASGSHGKERDQPRHHKQPAAPAPDATERGVSSKGEGNRAEDIAYRMDTRRRPLHNKRPPEAQERGGIAERRARDRAHRSPSSERSSVSDSSNRSRTPRHPRRDAPEGWKKKHRARGSKRNVKYDQRAHGDASDSDITRLDSADESIERARSPCGRAHGTHKRTRNHHRKTSMPKYSTRHEDHVHDAASGSSVSRHVQENKSRARAPDNSGMRIIDGLPSIVKLFASGWFDEDMYEPLLEVCDKSRLFGDPHQAQSVHSFWKALIFREHKQEAKWNTALKDLMSQLRQTRETFADGFMKIPEDLALKVMWQFAYDFLCWPKQSSDPVDRQEHRLKSTVYEDVGCYYRVLAIIQLGLVNFVHTHNGKLVLKEMPAYITAIEDLAKTLKDRGQMPEHTRQSHSLACQGRPKLMKSKPKRRARSWNPPNYPEKGNGRGQHWQGRGYTSAGKGKRKGGHNPDDDDGDIHATSQPAKGASHKGRNRKQHGTARGGKGGRKGGKKDDGDLSLIYEAPAMDHTTRTM